MTQPVERPDPGPGSFSCDDAVCKAGTEVCAPKTACGEDWPARGCVPVAELAARRFDPTDPTATCQNICFSWFDKKSCDGPTDCQTGEVCCYRRGRVIGSCTGGVDGYIDEYECTPVGQGRTPCRTAEVCSSVDSTCRRKGSKCVVDAATGLGSCQVPRRRPKPKCGAAPCAAGLACIERWDDGSRECVADPESYVGEALVIECDRGRDCAPDEGCFRGGSKQRCELSEMSWVGDDLPICLDGSDCVGVCGSVATATCYSDGDRRFCECRPRCRRDQDCMADDYCMDLSLNRSGGALLPLERFCDKRQQRCDCREPGAGGGVP
ncbi:MAG: hypothetical protein JRI68_17375 [Deltaproteobacteria bacterium]|nr:hypothetical protein [Deltaproteobacteria bacterium]